MCGIVGIKGAIRSEKCSSFLKEMIKLVRHRGPDEENTWAGEGVGFAHARLSIHDLSKLGRQPMFSQSKKWIIVFNGEIYNFRELKKSLHDTIIFRGDSDTEVLVNAIDIWGIEKTLQKCIGMFSFSAYDMQTKKMYLARDRLGEKPLYYGIQKDVFAFSSELKALKPLKGIGWVFDIDRASFSTYVRFGYIMSPFCIYKNIKKLEPGHYLEVSADNSIKSFAYWKPEWALEAERFPGTISDAVGLLDGKLRDSVKLQMASDVPLGAFLSGGVDSSIIVAMMQSMSSRQVKTFSLGFHEQAYNEALYARAVAKHLGTEHTDIYVTDKESIHVIPSLPRIYDEPFADASQIPTFLVSKLARSAVTVSLTGDGADEIFGGYKRYSLANQLNNKLINKGLLNQLIKKTPSRLFRGFSYIPGKISHLSDRLEKLQTLIRRSGQSKARLYNELCAQTHSKDLVINDTGYDVYKVKDLWDIKNLSFQEWMMFVDTATYLCGDILTKVDRAAMAVSLETRCPFLDHRIFEFSWSLPLEYKIRKNEGKHVLRQLLHRYIPKNLVNRPKKGFSVPLATWLRAGLKDWAESLLEPDRIEKQGYFNPSEVSRYWNEHQSGRRNWQVPLWNILMFQAWLDKENMAW